MKAVVFVDVQKDFIDGALRNEKAIEVTPKIVEFAKECGKQQHIPRQNSSSNIGEGWVDGAY